ncbi:MAG TPA: MarR family transcriptional regulator [Longimicrobiales bacterium]
MPLEAAPAPAAAGVKAGPGLEHTVFLALQRLASDLGQEVAELLKGAGLSGAQYNVLRILRGAGKSGLACGEIAGRMITRDPDITRLLDRLEKRGLVIRARESGDRRVVTTRITQEGRALLATLDEPVAQLHERQLAGLGEEKLERLLQLLEEAGSAGL